MILQAFTVYDSKAEAYLPPYFLGTRGSAIRAFSDAANDPKHGFNRHASDYTLFLIGEYDDSSGTLTNYDAKTSLGVAIEFRQEPEYIKEILETVKTPGSILKQTVTNSEEGNRNNA